MERPTEHAGKGQERMVFLLLTVALFPILAVLLVASYGFAVWVWQMFNGPPGG